MSFWPFGNEKVTVAPRRALFEPEPVEEAVIASRKPHIVILAFALVVLLLSLVVGDTQANTAEASSAPISASPVPVNTTAQTATSTTRVASEDTKPIPNVAKTSAPVKPKVTQDENFAASMTLGETEEPRTAPKTTEPTKKAEPKRVVTSTSAKPSSKPSKKASSKPSQKASSAPKKRVEPKKASAPKKRAAKPAAAFTGSTRGLRALAYAKAQIGEPYIRNGDGPYGFDCSGLTLKAWAAAGVKGMPHSARQQYSKYKKVSKGNLRKGDLVFFYSPIRHVGLYAGNGKVLHASNPSKPIGYLPMKYMPYAGAVRPG